MTTQAERCKERIRQLEAANRAQQLRMEELEAERARAVAEMARHLELMEHRRKPWRPFMKRRRDG